MNTTKLTDNEMNALREIGRGMSGAQFAATHPNRPAAQTNFEQ